MTNWRGDIDAARHDFFDVTRLAGMPLREDELTAEYLDCPHTPPARLPAGQQAVYAFWGDGNWLKIGRAGPNSPPRYTSQHYNPGSARSTLAASLIGYHSASPLSGFDPAQPKAWITKHCHRANLLLPARYQTALLALLEAFLHARLNPRFEGKRL